MEAAIVTVGDELLRGDTANSNATWLAGRLTDRGTTVTRITTIPDSVADIAQVVNEYHATYDAVVVTGGLGPTHDDVTLEGVAAALGRDLEKNQEALEWLVETGGYAAEDLAAGTILLPEDARVLHNETGVAPGCVVDSIYVLPGVPEEMKPMFESIAPEFTGERVHVQTVETPEPESALLDRIEAVRDRFDVTVGSYPGKTVRLKVSGADPEVVSDAATWLRERVESV